MTTTQNIPELKTLEYALTLGMTTMEGRGFYYPMDVGIGADGRMYVVNRSLENVTRGVRVTVCDIDSEYYGTFGSYGTAPGQFVWPSACAIDSRSRIFVSDESTHRISVFDAEGKLLTTWGVAGADESHFDTPSGLAFDSRDNLYVADTYNNRVQKFTADGGYLSTIGHQGIGDGEMNLPWGLAVDSKDCLYVADWGNDRIQKFSSDGDFLLAFGSTGRGDGEFSRPSSIAVDAPGNIYVADWGNERVQILDPDGGFLQKLRGEATLSKWAANFLAVNVEEGEARSRADLEPQIEYFIDDPHEESSHIEKYFWSPVSVKLDRDGTLYVTESNRHRIQVYKLVA